MGFEQSALGLQVPGDADDDQVRRPIVAAGEPRRDPSVKGLRVFSIKRPVDGWMWEGIVD